VRSLAPCLAGVALLKVGLGRGRACEVFSTACSRHGSTEGDGLTLCNAQSASFWTCAFGLFELFGPSGLFELCERFERCELCELCELCEWLGEAPRSGPRRASPHAARR
jgi:hypothetical protein